ncbi:MAG: DUF1189 family protein [Candidatus Roizmanbacteria bacterium]|nr:DUF1189 family protein [Candidatus Roizmanbacteria bacterium]
MKKLKTFWYSFQKSLLDFGYYKDVAKASFWFSYKYLFLLLICLSLIRSVQMGVGYIAIRKNIPSYITTVQRELVNIYPKELELRISNNKLYTNVKEPYAIEFPKVFGDMDGKHMVVIDTKGVVDDYPKYNTVILATKLALVYPDKQQGNRTSTQVYYFSDLDRSIYMDHAGYSKLIQRTNPFFAKLPKMIDIAVVVGIILLPFVGAFFWQSGTLLGLVFLTLIMWIIEKILKTSYGYKALFRMGMHGATWSILFSFLLDITNQKVSYLYNLIFVAWMIFVIVKNKEVKTVV